MKMTGGAWFSLLLAVFLAAMLYEGTTFKSKAWIYPVVIVTPTLILALIQLYRELRGMKKKDVIYDITPDQTQSTRVIYRKAGKYMAWILCSFALIWLIGFKLGFVLWFIIFLRVEGKRSWLKTLITVGVAVYLIMVQYAVIFGVHWPESILEKYVKLPF
ncbi:MAG: hypothetical protein QME90_04375 [Thermodesulfobacteriota bacterium]|nr:hypothetical protein [Thermodesulfobacteriota bacterium]